tara:strand:+ start:1869 stop:2900 length:1032 start_codon:yes stop_codon:yes gene_type:complete
MINVKISIPGQPEDLSIQQYIGNKENIYNNYKFYTNSYIENPDYWFVIESLNKESEECFIDPNNIVYLNSETSYPKDYFINDYILSYMKQFNLKYGCYNNFASNYYSALPFVPWLINGKNDRSAYETNEKDINYFKNLNSIEKNKLISVICSTKSYTDDHKARLNFVYKLKEHFQERLDWFGAGIDEIDKKWDGIANYKYHIAIENESRNNLISEKLFDSYLGLAFPIYYGAPNVEDYFPKSSLSKIDIMDYKKSVSIIEECIKSGAYEKNFESLIKSKNLVIEDYNLILRIIKIIEQMKNMSGEKKKVVLYNVGHYWKTEVNYKNKIKHYIKRKFRINVNNY